MKKIKLIFSISLILLILIFNVGCKKEVPKKAEIVQVTGEVEITSEEGKTIDVQIDLPVTVVTDCGDTACFEEKFAVCEPATLTVSLSSKLQYYYEIIGQENNECKIMSEFLANPNPIFVGQTMTCLYDNSKSFTNAGNEIIMSFNTDKHIGNCKGDLYELMTNI